MASITSSPSKPQSHIIDVPAEEEVQRGRKRRRSSELCPPMHLTSNGSTNLRGRGRHRSVSQSNSFQRSSLEERAQSTSPHRKSPGKKYQKKLTDVRMKLEKKRRSQSPSRSRSQGREGKGTPKPRRRQRTRSRSRSHGRQKVVKETKGIDHGKVIMESAVVD